MVKQVHPLTSVAVGFIAAGLAAYFNGFPVLAAAGMLVAFQLVGAEIPKYTSVYQFLILALNCAAFGFVMDYGQGHFPYVSVAFGAIAFSLLFRLIFYRNVLHTKFLFVEPLVMMIGLVSWIGGNIYFHAKWPDWFFPVIPLLFTLHLVIGFVVEGMRYNKIAKEKTGTKVGSPAPDFELPDQFGQPVRLSDLKGKRSVLLIFVRGDWCPACHMMLRSYARNSDKLRDRNVLLLAIGPDELGTNKEMADKLGLEYRVLADPKQEVAMAYGTKLDKDPLVGPLRPHYESGLPLPSSFLICRNGIIRYSSRADQVGEILRPEDIFVVLDQLN